MLPPARTLLLTFCTLPRVSLCATLQARDFDPQSLRKTLPAAVSAVHMAISEGGR